MGLRFIRVGRMGGFADVGAGGGGAVVEEGVLAVDSKGDVHFVELEEVDLQVMFLEDLADLGEEFGRADFAVGVYVDDCDGVFCGDGGGAFGSEVLVGILSRGEVLLCDEGSRG